MPIPSGGLVAKFNFGDPACFTDGGTSVLDLVGNNDLTFTNTNYTFNSANGTITTTASNEASTATVGTFPSGTDAYTVVCWAKTGTSTKRIFGFLGAPQNQEMVLLLDGSNLFYAANNGSSKVSTSGFAPNEWHMFAVTKAAGANSSAQLLYVDGVLVPSSHTGTDGQVDLTFSVFTSIGYNLGAPGFAVVSVGTAYVYDQVLSAANILDIYNNDKADYPFISYDFSDPACYPGSGSTVFDLAGSLNLPIVNATYGGTGQSKYFNFDGNGDYIGKTSVTGLGNTFTANMWYELTAVNSTGRQLWQVGVNSASGTNPGFYVNNPTTADLIYGFSYGVGTTSAADVLTANTWQMGTVTADGTTTKIYVDGVLAGSVAQGIGNWATGGFAIGAGVDGSGNISAGADGLLGNFALLDIYSSALGSTDITNIYNNTVDRFFPPPAPVSSYDFSDPACYPGTGNTVFDLTANNLDLPIVNATYSANGQASYFSFNGSNAYIGKAGVTGVGSTFTISFWAQQNTSNPQVPFSCGYYNSGGRGVQFTFSSSVSYDLAASFNFGIGYVSSLSTHSPNTWDMYTYTCDGTTSKLYINAVIQGSDTQDSAFWDTGSFAIGANTNSSGNITTGGDSLNGKIALLDVYNVALTAGDITTLYNDTKIRFDNIVASYDFSDPLCYPGTGSTIFDLSGSELDLPISGATFAGTGQSKYFSFDGSDYIGAKNLNLLPSDNTFSMNIWARKNSQTSGATYFLLSIGANPGPSGTNPYITANEYTEKYTVQFSNGIGAVISSEEVPNSVWSMITYTADGTNSKIYIDGVLTGTASQGIGSNPASNATLYIGAVTDGSNNPLVTNRFTGDVAIVDIYNTTLSAGDITTIYNNEVSRFGSPPPAYQGIVGGRQFAQGFNG